MHQTFPATPVRRSTRCRRAPEQYVIDVKHSSMDTYTSISSSVSPGAFRAATYTGLTSNLNNWVASNATQSNSALPAHMKLPTQDVINKTFSRTKQLKLANFFSKQEQAGREKSRPANLKLCLLCQQSMEQTWNEWRESCLKACNPIFSFADTVAEQEAAAAQVRLFISHEAKLFGNKALSVAAKLKCVATKHLAANLPNHFCNNSLVKELIERSKQSESNSSAQLPMLLPQGSDLSATYIVMRQRKAEGLNRVAVTSELIQLKYRVAADVWRWQGQAN